MKIHGEEVYVPGLAYAVIPRPGKDIVFTCQSILDYAEMEALCPAPTAPWVRPRQGPSKQDFDDKEFRNARGDWAEKRQAWMVLKSMQATDGLTWDTVDMSDHTTWPNYTTELQKCGFAPMEIARIVDAVYEACGLNQSKIDEAMERFLSGERAKANAESSRVDEASVTSAGEPASVSA